MTNNLRTVVMFIFSTLIATSLNAQTEEPDWQDPLTHTLDSDGTIFPQEAAYDVLKAAFGNDKADGDDSIKVTNLVEFCDDFYSGRCFTAAIYVIDPDSTDQKQFLVWLERVSTGPVNYRKIWEYQTGGGIVWASLSAIYPKTIPGITSACLLIKTSHGGDGQNVEMKIICLGDSDSPEILWEYNGDFWGSSQAQPFRKSIVIFRDIDNDQVDELILDTIEGYQPAFEQGDRTFKIHMQRTVFYYSPQVKFFVGGVIPGGPVIK